MLGKMLGCTLGTSRLDASIEAWQRWLDYRLISRGRVSAAQARAWGAEAMVGRELALLAAPSMERSWLRLIEAPDTPGYERLRTWGWNALEILVADPYALASELAGSAFQVVIPPRPIPYDPRIHAMQVVGPAGELLYFTQLPAAGTPLGLSAARQRLDHGFIAILGGPSLGAMLAFYRATFGNEVVPGRPTIVRIVNETFGLPEDHRIGLGIVRLAPGFLIEVDESPAGAAPRPRLDGALPPGIAMMSFEVAAGDWPEVRWRSTPTSLAEPPYGGSRAGIIEGAAGEWIELIELGAS